MIDTTSFNVRWGVVDHTLDSNKWTWDKIHSLVEHQTSINNLYYRNFGEGGFTLGGLDQDPYCKDVLDFLQPLLPNYYARAGLYAGTTPTSKTFDLHKDPGQHLWVWQIIGDTLWQVEDSKFVLQENQMLYILPGLLHCAIPDSPRASITFSLEEFD